MCLNHTDWRPACDLETLRKRADLVSQIRLFFRQREVLEVETPLLCAAAATDPHLGSMTVEQWPGSPLKYLQTSPEFAMKRLLAAGSGPIYQICKAFRREERGKKHNSEFTMLEWYRPGFDEFQLMDEVADVVSTALANTPGQRPAIERVSYRELFDHFVSLDPFTAELTVIAQLAADLSGITDATALGRDTCLDLIMTHAIEPQLLGKGIFVYHYPASQAALAKVAQIKGVAVARRFELYIDGMELANGYFELTDPVEQLARFEKDNRLRRQLGLSPVLHDTRLCAALGHMPDCAGVALGVDRLLMVATGATSISQVLAFPEENA